MCVCVSGVLCVRVSIQKSPTIIIHARPLPPNFALIINIAITNAHSMSVKTHNYRHVRKKCVRVCVRPVRADAQRKNLALCVCVCANTINRPPRDAPIHCAKSENPNNNALVRCAECCVYCIYGAFHGNGQKTSSTLTYKDKVFNIRIC